jgi:hypothetical protein
MSAAFVAGMQNAVLVPAHLLAIIGVSLLVVQERQRRPIVVRWAAPLLFAGGLAAGVIMIARAYVPTFAGETLLGLMAVTGIWTALRRGFLPFAPLLLAAMTAFVVALDSPPDAVSLQAAAVMQFGTFFAAILLFTVLVECGARLERDWQRIGVRILGSWIAASAILVLALRLSR